MHSVMNVKRIDTSWQEIVPRKHSTSVSAVLIRSEESSG
jgi:hypothetical protein